MANRFKKAAESRGSRVDVQPETVESTPTPSKAEIAEQSPTNIDEPKPMPKASDGSKNLPRKTAGQVGMSLKVPKEMHEAMKYHYASTGEKMTAYIIRLVEEDMGRRF